MFFYRPWVTPESQKDVQLYIPAELDIFRSAFSNSRWGYAALLIITLVAGVLTNAVFLASFGTFRSFKGPRKIPNLYLFCMSLRDLAVSAILVPICVDWYVVKAGYFPASLGADAFCKFVAFLDHMLAAEYPVLVVAFAVTLFTRRFPKLEDLLNADVDGSGLGYGLTMEDVPGPALPLHSQYSGSRPPSVFNDNSRYGQQQQLQPRGGPAGLVAAFSPNGASTPTFVNPHQGRPAAVRPPSASGSAGSVGGHNHHHRGRTGPRPGNNLHQSSSSSSSAVVGLTPVSRGVTPPRHGVPRRPGSVTGSIEGRLAAGRMLSSSSSSSSAVANRMPPVVAAGGRISTVPEAADEDGGGSSVAGGFGGGGGGGQGFNNDPNNKDDLWESASMEYPGRNQASPNGWEFMEDFDDDLEPVVYDEPKYHGWHLWLLGATWLVSAGMAVPAAMFAEYLPNVNRGRPGCYIPSDPLANPYSFTINDPAYNFNLSFVILVYLVPLAAVLVLACLIVCRRTRSAKFARYLKILIWYYFVFAASRSALDGIQLGGMISAARGFRQLNTLPYEMEYEVLMVWATYVPTFVHPILYWLYCSEFRRGSRAVLRKVCGCKPELDKEEQKLATYKEAEILETRSTVSKTQTSTML